MPRGRTYIFRRSREPSAFDVLHDHEDQPGHYIRNHSSQFHDHVTDQPNAQQRYHDSRVLIDRIGRQSNAVSPRHARDSPSGPLHMDLHARDQRVTFQQNDEELQIAPSNISEGPSRQRPRVTPKQDFFKWTKRRKEILRRQEAAEVDAAAEAEAIPATHAGSNATRRHQHQSRRRLHTEDESEESGSGGNSSRSPGRPVVSGPGSSSTGGARDDSPSNTGIPPLRYSNADLYLSGWLMKRGKRLGSRVDRFVQLNGSFLSNARAEGSRPTWCVNLRGSKILAGPNREIVFKVENSFFSFYAPADELHAMWLEALQCVSAVSIFFVVDSVWYFAVLFFSHIAAMSSLVALDQAFLSRHRTGRRLFATRPDNWKRFQVPCISSEKVQLSRWSSFSVFTDIGVFAISLCICVVFDLVRRSLTSTILAS